MTIDLANIESLESSSISLKELSWSVTARDLLVTCCARQTYRNTGRKNREISYTFPLSWKSIVTEFAVTTGGERLVARAFERTQAEERYEKALEEGDSPMMLEVNEYEGLCTANLGNLMPGEELVLEISLAWMADWDNGTVRIAIPTVIADRYDPDGSQGGLLPHQRVESSFLAEYPCSARFDLSGILAFGSVSCPGRTVRVSHKPGRTIVDVPCGYADRDLALVVSEVRQTPPSLFARDGGEWIICPSFTPQPDPQPEPAALGLKVLVDCSGSMEGASIAQAKKAIAALRTLLNPEDTVTLSCFGSTVEHRIKTPRACTPAFWRRSWLVAVEQIEADLGGTELMSALEDVTRLKTSEGRNRDILLITDGEVWQAEELVSKLGKAGHRIFALGVGLSPAEQNLRHLAQATGGDCAFALPGEQMSGIVAAFIGKMRRQPIAGVRVAPLPASRPDLAIETGENAFAGQAYRVFSALPEKPTETPVIRGTLAGRELTVQAAPWKEATGPELAALAAWNRYQSEDDEQTRVELACRYSLLTDRTNLILVKERAEGEKAQQAPEFERIAQMTPMNLVRMDSDMVCEDVCCGAPCMSAMRMDAPLACEIEPSSEETPLRILSKIAAAAVFCRQLADLGAKLDTSLSQPEQEVLWRILGEFPELDTDEKRLACLILLIPRLELDNDELRDKALKALRGIDSLESGDLITALSSVIV